MNKKLILLIISCNFLLGISSNAYSKAESSIENFVAPGTSLTTDDIIELAVEVDTKTDNTIDTSPLQKDFNIINQTQQVYHSIINGKAKSKVRWLISMQAKNPGIINIPSLAVGTQRTNTLQIEVKSPIVDPNQAQPIFLNVEASDQSVYINSPLKILVNVYVSTDLTVRSLQLNALDLEYYKIEKISEDNKQTFYKNKRYHMYQVKYLAFYNKSGSQKLPKFNLSGLKLKDTNQPHDIFSLYQQQWQPFNRSSQELTIDILPKHESFTDKPWIIADSIKITQNWSNTKTEITVGDALQRTIKITGKNILAENLPNIFETNNTANQTNNYKVYIDKPQRSSTVESGNLISTLSQKITYIPTKAGNLELPSKTISWWNNKADIKIDSIIEGKKYSIINNGNSKKNNINLLNTPINQSQQNQSANNLNNQNSGPGLASNLNNLSDNTSLQAAKTNNSNEPNETSGATRAINQDSKSLSPINYNLDSKIISLFGYKINMLENFNYVMFFLIGIIALLTVIIFNLLHKSKQLAKIIYDSNINLDNNINNQRNIHSKLNTKILKQDLNQQINLLKNHTVNQDTISVYKTLCAIANLIYPDDIHSIELFKTDLPDNNQIAIDKLLAAVYSPNKVTWDNIDFVNNVIPSIESNINNVLKSTSKSRKFTNKMKSNKSKLPELYPE